MGGLFQWTPPNQAGLSACCQVAGDRRRHDWLIIAARRSGPPNLRDWITIGTRHHLAIMRTGKTLRPDVEYLSVNSADNFGLGAVAAELASPNVVNEGVDRILNYVTEFFTNEREIAYRELLPDRHGGSANFAGFRGAMPTRNDQHFPVSLGTAGGRAERRNHSINGRTLIFGPITTTGHACGSR